MQDLRSAVKGGVDPNGLGSSMIAADVLWSDPVAEPGLQPNTARGVGLIFGPDVTQVLEPARPRSLGHMCSPFARLVSKLRVPHKDTNLCVMRTLGEGCTSNSFVPPTRCGVCWVLTLAVPPCALPARTQAHTSRRAVSQWVSRRTGVSGGQHAAADPAVA